MQNELIQAILEQQTTLCCCILRNHESFPSLFSYPVSHALFHQFYILEALVLESAFIHDRRDALVEDHREVYSDKDKDDNDAGPAAKVPRLSIIYKLCEHDQMVGTDDDQDFVDELKCARHPRHKRLEVADVDHNKAAHEDN